MTFSPNHPPVSVLKYLAIAQSIGQLSLCRDAKVGAILVAGNGDVIATGCNKKINSGLTCYSQNCKTHRSRSNGDQHSECTVAHAEFNVVSNCRKHGRRLYAPPCTLMVVTRPPCFSCLLNLREFRVEHIIYQGDPVDESLFPEIQFSRVSAQPFTETPNVT